LNFALVSGGAILLYCGIAGSSKPLKAFITAAIIMLLLKLAFKLWTKDDYHEAFLMKALLSAPVFFTLPVIGFMGHLWMLNRNFKEMIIGSVTRKIFTWAGGLLFMIGLCRYTKLVDLLHRLFIK
jgi:hypothetical protein